jgi:nucleotide-binding universal stress UspA family protein
MDIIVGFVDSPAGRAALAAGVHEARVRGAALHVIHVARVGVRNESPEVIDRYHRRLTEIDEELRALGSDVRSELLFASGDPVDTLLEEVTRVGAGLLVLGIRRRSPVGKLVFGSTSQQLLLRAECAVLAVKA